MDKRTVAVYTLGCKVNQCESQDMIDIFRQKGWQAVDFDSPASLYIVNTCTVTQAADQKSRKMIRGAKKQNPDALLVVTGCYAESGKVKLEAISDIDLILSNKQKESLPELAEKAWSEKAARPMGSGEAAAQAGDEAAGQASGEAAGQASGEAAGQARGEADGQVGGEAAGQASGKAAGQAGGEAAEQASGEAAGQAVAFEPIKGLDRTRAAIKLQDGCRQFCSFCIIPYVRKELHSLPEKDALYKAGRLYAAGYREIVLLGVHLGAYGSEDGGSGRLAHVFEKLLTAYPGIRFRLGSLEPMEASDKLIALIRDFPNACKHLHLPLQSGSDAVLQEMGRPYLSADYRRKAGAIREMVPDIALTTDVMVGFPGEGDGEFLQSLAFAEEMAFSRIHVFAYSRRPGTPAAAKPGQVTKADKDKRSEEYIRLGATMQASYGGRWVGRQLQVLVEEEIADGIWSGRSDNYIEATFAQKKVDTRIEKELNKAGACNTGIGLKGKIISLKIAGQSPYKAGAWHGVRVQG